MNNLSDPLIDPEVQTQVTSTLVSIGICTFRRPELFDALSSLAQQVIPDGYALEVVIADNDDDALLEEQVNQHAQATGLNLRYCHAPARNISIARNACMEAARGDVLIFIDDDETADPGWLGTLIAKWKSSQAQVVFGPSYATYPAEAPQWMIDNDVHSNIPLERAGIVETGYSCNVLLDLTEPLIAQARFDLAFGRTGGEDTDFFFRLHRAGVPMAITMDAVLREVVAEKRLSTRWVLRRRLSTGQCYGHSVTSSGANTSTPQRLVLVTRSAAKVVYCVIRSLLSIFDKTQAYFWTMRALFHVGVARGAISRPATIHYGDKSL